MPNFSKPLKIFNILHSSKYDNWEVCKSCYGQVKLIMPNWFQEMVLGKLGTLVCNNCGNRQEIP